MELAQVTVLWHMLCQSRHPRLLTLTHQPPPIKEKWGWVGTPPPHYSQKNLGLSGCRLPATPTGDALLEFDVTLKIRNRYRHFCDRYWCRAATGAGHFWKVGAGWFSKNGAGAGASLSLSVCSRYLTRHFFPKDSMTSTWPTQTWRQMRKNYNWEDLANSGLAHLPSKKTKVTRLCYYIGGRAHYSALFLARHYFFLVHPLFLVLRALFLSPLSTLLFVLILASKRVFQVF